MQGKWKSKYKHLKKEKYKCLVQTKQDLNPKVFAKQISVSVIYEYELKQKRCPNNKRKKFYRKLVAAKNRRIKRDWLRSQEWDKEIPTHKLAKSIIREII